MISVIFLMVVMFEGVMVIHSYQRAAEGEDLTDGGKDSRINDASRRHNE